MTRALIGLLAALALQGAAAQGVWRCGADGRTYTDTPCPEGRLVAMADTRPGAAVPSADQVVARDRALARRLHDERVALERERPAGGAVAGSLSAPRPALKTVAERTPKPPTQSKKKSAPGFLPAAAGTSPSAGLSSRPQPG